MILLKDLKKVLKHRYFIIEFINANDNSTYIPTSKGEKYFDDWAVEYFMYSQEFKRILIKVTPLEEYCFGEYFFNDPVCLECPYSKKCIEESETYEDFQDKA